MARRIPVADEAIAQVALTSLLEEADRAEMDHATVLVEAAARVQFQPSTRRIVLTFDLGMSSSDEPAGT